jgi:exosortase A-associated hydrolase 1
MKYTEETTLFACASDTLLGILAKPQTPCELGVVVIVGGPQYRVGSHRQFVLLSRALAAAGYAVLRFDYRGMGDSTGAQRDFENVTADIAAAIDELQRRLPAVKQVALWGLCDGASAALLYCHETHDPRVTGLCLLNPWVRSEASLAKTQVKHYYAQRLMQKEFWLKLLSGKVALSALSGFAQKVRLMASGPNRSATEKQTFQQRMATAWHGFTGHILLILSGDDYTAKEFLEYADATSAWRGALSRANVLRSDVPGVDHTFSSAAARKLAEDLTLDWLAQNHNRGREGRLSPLLCNLTTSEEQAERIVTGHFVQSGFC